MYKKLPTYKYSDFSTGLSQIASIFADVENPVSPNYGLKVAGAANNVIMNENGLEKFPGYDAYLASAVSGTPVITGLYEYRKTGASTSTYFIVCAGTKVYTASGGSLTEIYSGITAGTYCNFETFNNVCLIMNGVDSVLQFDGTTCTTVTFTDPSNILNSAKPSFATVFRNRIFYSGDLTNPSKVWSPRPGTYNNFDNATSLVDAFDISGGDNYRVTGLKALSKDLMVVYKEGSIFRLSGSTPFGSTADPFRLEEVSREVGCIATRTIVQVGRDQFFLSLGGAKRLSIVNDYGDVIDADPSFEIKDLMAEINYTTSVVAKAFAVYVKSEHHLYLHVPTGSGVTNTQTYVYDIMSGANMPRSGITASYGAIVNQNYYTGDYSGQIYQQLVGDNYNGAAIPSSWESKWLDYGGLKNRKKFKNLLIYFETSGTATITVQWTVMNMDGSTRAYSRSSEATSGDVWDLGLWDVMLWDAGANNLFRRNNLGRGRAIKIKISNNNADEYWKVSKVELCIENLGRVPN